MTPERVRPLAAALRDGILRGKVEVEEAGGSLTLRRIGRESLGPPMTIYLDDGALSWRSHLPDRDEHWLLNCVACIVARVIEPEAMVEAEEGGRRFRADFDRQFPTLKSYLTRPTGRRSLDAISRAVWALSKPSDVDGIPMAAAPF